MYGELLNQFPLDKQSVERLEGYLIYAFKMVTLIMAFPNVKVRFPGGQADEG